MHLLAVFGIFTLVANLVAQRTREIGIRIALGSTISTAMIHVGGSGVGAAAFGLVLGLAMCIGARVDLLGATSSYKEQMETYDWGWVETQVDQTVKVWHDSAGVSVPPARRYSLEEQRVNEDAYDEALLEIEDTLRPPPITGKEQTRAQDRIVASFARFSANALG